MSQTISPHFHAHAPHTAGRVIHWAARYDLFVPLFTFGRVRRLRSRIADLVQAQPGDAILDVGCGPGDLALLLARRVGSGGMAAGIDASPEMIARARQKAGRRGLTVDFRLEPVEALSFADHTFDGVVSSLMYHHLPADLKPQALASIARVLKPGGRVCIVDFMPHPDSRRGRMATNMAALADLLRDARFVDIRDGYGLPSLGLLTTAMGLPPVGYVMARTPDHASEQR
ncbi:MAG TPA: methyltransferase domain-containing protein [Ktedonobacterales bacterium]|jgi:ubiquinone/menaquinone biosynthesis C-methylase UbiE